MYIYIHKIYLFQNHIIEIIKILFFIQLSFFYYKSING